MTRIDVLYVSSAPSPKQFASMKDQRRNNVEEVTYGMAESGFKFQNLIQQGLVAEGAVVHSVVGRAATPLFYRGGYWRRVRESLAPDYQVDHLGFPNVRGLKQLWLSVSFFFRCLGWRLRTRSADQRVMVADAAYVSVLPAALLACAGRGIAKVAIFADLYPYMADVSDASREQSAFHRLLSFLVRASYDRLDGYIFLTEGMDEIVNRRGLPHMIMEGVADAQAADSERQAQADPVTFDVLYAGALREAYGLGALLEGFSDWDNSQARLIIYGAGDYASEVRAASEGDQRIEYRGTVTIEEVIEAEMAASLLVNPRPADREFTRFSFPSKNMEYMTTGTPVLTTPLQGMPAEYRDYVRLIEGEGAAGITAALDDAWRAPRAELRQLGASARDFVLTRKSNREQARRILEFAGGLV